MTIQDITLAPALPKREATQSNARNLINPFLDFLCLGGLSLLLMPFLHLLPDQISIKAVVTLTMAQLSYAINYPHFAYSYQIFYRGFLTKLFNLSVSRGLRLRYFMAGIIVPVFMIALFALSIHTHNQQLMGFSVNLMFFFVGWHYRKQAYGILIMDSVFKKRFFNDREKFVLRFNAYACWLLSWAAANHVAKFHMYFGIPYYTFSFPWPLLYVLAVVALISSLGSMYVFVRKSLIGQPVPFNGVVAYLATIYAWGFIFVKMPLAVFIIPALHSLQYMVVVWRYEVNRDAAISRSSLTLWLRFYGFMVLGILIGYLGFSGIPHILDRLIHIQAFGFIPPQGFNLNHVLNQPYHLAAQPHAPVIPIMMFANSFLFLFMFEIFINIHHYFIDNVIWRGDNPETRAYLFADQKKEFPREAMTQKA